MTRALLLATFGGKDMRTFLVGVTAALAVGSAAFAANYTQARAGINVACCKAQKARCDQFCRTPTGIAQGAKCEAACGRFVNNCLMDGIFPWRTGSPSVCTK